VLGLIDPLSYFWEAVSASKAFVVHVLDHRHRRLSEQMAGKYPGPDARFEEVELSSSRWGPVIESVPNRAFCTFSGFVEVGDSLAVKGDVDEFALAAIDDPLVYFRGD